MTATATRLGSSPLMLDWSSLSREGVGTMLSFQDAWTKLKLRFDEGEVGYYNAPVAPELSQVTECEDLARSILSRNTFKDCLFLGIGGSALGPLSLLDALKERCSTGIRFHILDNPDPMEWKSTLSTLQPESTLVCIVTKSGTTFETMAQALAALDWLGKDRWHSHVVAITDPKRGDLKAFSQAHDLPTLHIAPSIGGRFSIFSPVGLFPAALAGLSASSFLKGAAEVREYVEKTPLEKNPFFVIGKELIRGFEKRPIHVCMPYSSRLKLIGNWFVQLWGESLGKDGKGFTPLAAVGATDQHSILQLLRDGPDDKVTFFVTLDKVSDPVKVPKLPRAPGTALYPAFGLLEGHTFQELLRIEYQATSLVLTRRGRPHMTWQVAELDERNLGALYFSYSMLTAVTGTLWGVNPFDQPGVEEGKVYIREALQRERSGMRELEEDDTNSPVARLRRSQLDS